MQMQYLRQERAQIGARLREARERAGIDAAEAASAAHAEVVAVAAWERGRNLPCLVQFRGLIAAYGVSANQVLFGSEPVALDGAQAAELTRAVRGCSPALRAKVDVIVAVLVSESAPQR